MLRWAAFCALVAAATPPAPAPPPQGLLLDRIVAVVDSQTVTQAELEAEARLAVVRRLGNAEIGVELVPDAAFLHDFLTYLIGQMLVAREARRVGAEDVGDVEVEQAYATLSRNFASEGHLDAFLADLGVTTGFVRDVLRRERTNDRYLAQRLRTRLAGLGVRTEAPVGRAAAQEATNRRAAELRAFLPAYISELRQAVEVRRLTPKGALERQPRR